MRAFADRYYDDADELGVDLIYALDTHIHADHISGVRGLDAAASRASSPQPPWTAGSPTPRSRAPRDLSRKLGGRRRPDDYRGRRHLRGWRRHHRDRRDTRPHDRVTSYLVDDSLLATGDGLFIDVSRRPDLERATRAHPTQLGCSMSHCRSAC